MEERAGLRWKKGLSGRGEITRVEESQGEDWEG